MQITLIFLAVAGHVALWVALVNRLHATSIAGRKRSLVTLAGFAGLLSVPLALAATIFRGGVSALDLAGISPPLRLASLGYAAACWLALAAAAAAWVGRRLLSRPPDVLRDRRAQTFRPLVPPSGSAGDKHHFLARLPGNQILDLEVCDLTVELPRLPAALDGLSLVHLADPHFTGRVGKSYFLEAVRLANRLQPDLIRVTGDLIDHPACTGWLGEIFGKLEARFGVYFVLGNHDLEFGGAAIRRELTAAGLVDLGGRWTLVAVRGRQVLLAGNEIPWFPPAADLSGAPPPAPAGPPRIFLAHSPDQIGWARSAQADLLLAGHTHGGQIRLPILGPIFAPSRWGVRYASGLFYAAGTTMHVSRGLSAEFPVRIGCLPELTHLVLRSPVAK